jgi:L-threonylcarbamoyladenylate synthase
LRPGAITAQMITESTGLDVVGQSSDGAAVDSNAIRVSGSLEAHYAPMAKVLLCETPSAGQGFIAHANIQTPEGVVRLASPRDDEEFARILYAALRAADKQGLREIVVRQPIGMEIGVAIRDRLKRAAHVDQQSDS